MPWHHRLDVLRAILDEGAVPTFVAPDPDAAFAFAAGCRDGGARVVEFTNRGDFAYATFSELARRVSRELPDVVLGAGTIIDAPTAALFIAAGASFIVGQSLSEDVARLCNRRRIAYIPGAGSATEIAQAEELGCEIVKLFPAAAFDGPAFVRNFLAPSPASRLMPTNVEASEEIDPGLVRRRRGLRGRGRAPVPGGAHAWRGPPGDRGADPDVHGLGAGGTRSLTRLPTAGPG